MRKSAIVMSLYRKYRPQTFEDVVGQDHIAQTLRNALSVEPVRVAHAYLFCGPRGTGKTTTARLLAKCLNCEQGPTPTPCNECDFCVRVRDNQAVMDLIEIDAASNTGVDNVRENIIDKVSVTPAQGRYRVYIIDEVHMLSTSSFNALLKTLEEPPAHAIFVLATTDAHKVPPTISSRCQRFDFRRVGPGDIVRRLQYVAANEQIDLSVEAARLIAYTADGALRDALTLLEQVASFSPATISEADVRLVLGTVPQELLVQIVDAVVECQPAAVLRQIEYAVEEGASFSQVTRDLVGYCRDLLLLTVGFESDGGLSDGEKKQRHHHAQRMGQARLMSTLENLRAAEKEMRQSIDHRLLLELTLVRAASELGGAMTTPVAAPIAAPAVASAPATAPVPLWKQPKPAPSPHAPSAASPHAPSAAPPHVPPAASPHVPPAPSTPAPTVEAAPEMANGVIAADNDIEAPADAMTPTDLEPEAAPTPAKPAEKKRGRRIHNLEEFIELWPAVLVRMKKEFGLAKVAFLYDARPVGLDESDAVVEFQKEFHYAKACEAARQITFEQVLDKCLATPHRLRFQLAQAPSPPPAPVEAMAISDEDDDDAEEDVFKVAQDMFGAEVVGKSGPG
ncbi:MAG TPA: DNA polymerase III subunit gamma/tau [Abditibacteriaceae bacterium]|nr:DNA polymerase III subunit gamma/tau [Abditibacteriaceae bacterium]